MIIEIEFKVDCYEVLEGRMMNMRWSRMAIE